MPALDWMGKIASASAENVLTASALENMPSAEAGFDGVRAVYAEGGTAPDGRPAKLGVAFRQVPCQIEGI